MSSNEAGEEGRRPRGAAGRIAIAAAGDDRAAVADTNGFPARFTTRLTAGAGHELIGGR